MCRAMGSLPAGLFRGEIAWRLAAPGWIQFIFSLWRRCCCRLLKSGLAPGRTPLDAAWPLAGCPFAIDDPTFGQIVRRHFHVYVVSNDRADSVTAHFTCRVGDDPMLIVECHAEASVGQDLVDLAFHRQELFLRQTSSLRTNNRPRTGVSRRGAMQHEREKGAGRAAQIPSQTTLGDFHIARCRKIASWLPLLRQWQFQSLSEVSSGSCNAGQDFRGSGWDWCLVSIQAAARPAMDISQKQAG